jgi:hypothetical protein
LLIEELSPTRFLSRFPQATPSVISSTTSRPRFLTRSTALMPKNLTLWRVDQPVIAVNKHNPILLSAIDSLTELDPIDDISDIFPEAPPKKTIHIII